MPGCLDNERNWFHCTNELNYGIKAIYEFGTSTNKQMNTEHSINKLFRWFCNNCCCLLLLVEYRNRISIFTSLKWKLSTLLYTRNRSSGNSKRWAKKKLCSFVRFQCTINAWWQCRLPKYQTLSLSDTCCMSYYLICNNSRVSLRSVLLLFYFAFFRHLPIYLFINTQSNPHKKKKRQKRKKHTIYNTEHTSVARHQ